MKAAVCTTYGPPDVVHEAKVKDLALVKELADAGRIVPVVDQTVPLARIADAYRHLDRQGKRGTTVLDLP